MRIIKLLQTKYERRRIIYTDKINNMNTIKYLKPNSTGKQKIKLNGITYKPYSVCDLPANFGCISFNEKEGVSSWFNHKGLTYIYDK